MTMVKCGRPGDPALRKRGHNKEGRDGNPQVVVGLALTRDGLPVRSWVFPGNTADVTTINHLKDDLRGWRLKPLRLCRDSGMFSEANRQRSAGPWAGTFCGAEAQGHRGAARRITRAGRTATVAHNLRVKEVYVRGGRARRRYWSATTRRGGTGTRPSGRLLSWSGGACRGSTRGKRDHPEACELMASRRFGRYLRMDTHGRLNIDTTKVTAEASMMAVRGDDQRRHARRSGCGAGYTSMMLMKAASGE